MCTIRRRPDGLHFNEDIAPILNTTRNSN
jgi:hypothetical protein